MSPHPETDVHAEGATSRKADYDILPLFLNRWSPRSMTGESLGDDELLPLFEAARWAPSSFNSQLWRFIIARRQDADEFAVLLHLLTESNQAWAQDASALVVEVAGKRFESNGLPSSTHSFDAGAAWENLALEAARRGLVAHGIEGFDHARARLDLGIPADYDILAMIAIGKRGPREKLPERARSLEQPNARRPLKDILYRGRFGLPLIARP
jgi:nitroreductase